MSLRENLLKTRETNGKADSLDRRWHLKSNVSRIQASPILISWDLLRLYNRMFGKCPLDNEPLTRMHLELNHDIKVPDIDVLMQKGFLIEKKLK